MDQILINDLLARGVLGVTDDERRRPQDILFNIILFTNTTAAGLSDHLSDTTSYSSVAKEVLAYAETAARYTVEALAEDVAVMLLKEKGVLGVRVRVEKPGAIRFARSVGVEIERYNIIT